MLVAMLVMVAPGLEATGERWAGHESPAPALGSGRGRAWSVPGLAGLGRPGEEEPRTRGQ